MFIYDLFSEAHTTQEQLVKTVTYLCISAVIGISITIILIIQLIKRERKIKELIKERLGNTENQVVTEEIRLHLKQNFSVREIEETIKKEFKEFIDGRDVHVEEIETDQKELDRERIFILTVGEKDSEEKKTYLFKMTPIWLRTFWLERKAALKNRNQNKK